MSSLEGKRVALLEAHLEDEAATQVRRFGGVPYSVPAMREVLHPERVGAFIDRLRAREIFAVSFLTGVGAAALLDEARRLGRLEEALAGLRHTVVACRGPKPVAVLEQHRVPVQIVALEPATSRHLVEAFAAVDVAGRTIAVVRDGDGATATSHVLADALRERGARVEELWLYEWAMPLDVEPMTALVRDLVAGRVDAIAFTNRVQVRHLLHSADTQHLLPELVAALNGKVLVAAVGPVCAEALHVSGVEPDIIPAQPTMESMIGALADYIDLMRDLPD